MSRAAACLFNGRGRRSLGRAVAIRRPPHRLRSLEFAAARGGEVAEAEEEEEEGDV